MEDKISQLENKITALERKLNVHQHSNIDGTNILRKTIILDQDQQLLVGVATHASQQITGEGTALEQVTYSINVDRNTGTAGIVYKSNGMQMDFLHQPNGTLSFVVARRKPIVSPIQGVTVTTSSGGNTVTISGYGFTTNELAGALIDITDSGGNFIETQTVASNTATAVTISGTWTASTSGGTFEIYRPVFLGSADFIWQRVYVQEDTAGGVRFGVGPTAGGQNGLLYMDATGDLYWRNKAGVATKVFLYGSTPLAGTKIYYVSDTNGGPTDRKLTFTNGILTAEV